MACIILVEDNTLIQEAVSGYLQLDNHQTIEFGTTDGVMETIERNVADLAILDVMLPDGNGFSLAKSIRNVSDIPLIFLTAFDYAASNGMRDVISALEDGQRQTDNAGNTTLHQACYLNQSEVAEALIKAGNVDINAPNDHGDTPLLMACENQNVYLVEILLKAGADPNRKLLNGFAPLHYAASEENYPIAKALLAGGADSNVRNLDGETPLIFAAREGENDMTALLIENGADVNLTDNMQHSALHYATENGYTEIVEQLLVAGAEG